MTQLDRLSATTVAIGVEIPNRAELAFLPGQYVNIAVPGTDQSRSYSFSNAPHDELLTFLVKLTPGGAMSEYLASRARVGDTIIVHRSQRIVLLARDRSPGAAAGRRYRVGTGAVDAAHLRDRTASARPTSSTASAPTKTWWRSTRSEEIASALPGFTWDYCVSDPASRAANKGYVTGLIRPAHLYDGDVAVYLCGPPPMVEAVRTHVTDAGDRADRLLLREVRAGRTVADARDEDTATSETRSTAARGEHCCPPAMPARSPARPMLPQRGIAAVRRLPVTRIDDGNAAIRSIAGQLMAPARNRVPNAPRRR